MLEFDHMVVVVVVTRALSFTAAALRRPRSAGHATPLMAGRFAERGHRSGNRVGNLRSANLAGACAVKRNGPAGSRCRCSGHGSFERGHGARRRREWLCRPTSSWWHRTLDEKCLSRLRELLSEEKPEPASWCRIWAAPAEPTPSTMSLPSSRA